MLEKEWHLNSNHICILSAKDEVDLFKLKKNLDKKHIAYSIFREPDLNNELTAIALEPAGKKLVSSYSLALKEFAFSKKKKEKNHVEQILKDMDLFEQTPGMSIRQHGISVLSYYDDFKIRLQFGEEANTNYKNVRIPEWFLKYKEELLANQLPDWITDVYLEYHDIGKPYCRFIDDDGRQHFPNHAEVSYKTWMSIEEEEELHRFFSSYNICKENQKLVGELIKRDMEIHTMKAADVKDFCRDPKQAATLLIAGLAEVHSNAAMFGGINSTSFKIKWKQVDKRGRAICKELWGDR